MTELKRKTPSGETEPQKFQTGETVRILRPHLWSGAVGDVVSFKDGLHRIKIPCRDQDGPEKFWHADVAGSQLEGWI